MSKKRKTFSTTYSPENIERIELIAAQLHLSGEENYANKAASANKLIELGYHTYNLLNREAVPLIDTDILDEIDQTALALHNANIARQQNEEVEKT